MNQTTSEWSARANRPRGARRNRLARGITLLFCLLVFAGLVSGHTEKNAAPQPDANASYNDEIIRTYDFKFGKDKPFLPSLANSASGGFIDPATFYTADYCAKCHKAAHQEWRETAHANSFRAPFYKKNVELLINTKGIEYSRHCEGCHNPIALFSGSLTSASKVDRSFDEDGITCSVCHSIQSLQPTAGMGSYVMGVPAVMVDDNGAPVTRQVSDEEIFKRPDLHQKAVMKEIYKSPEFCGACHKAALPKSLNDYKWLRAFSTYDEWQQSSWAKQSPLPFYKKDKVYSCQECHMPKTDAPGDYGAKNGKLASHRWLGANTAIPEFYGYQDQMQKVTAFLQDNLFNIDFFALRKGSGEDASDDNLIAPLDKQNVQLKAGEVVTLNVVIQNKGIGHSLVPEQRDFYESWVELQVNDAAGRTICHSGYLKPDGFLDDKAHSYTNRLVGEGGEFYDLHQVWKGRTRAFDNTILPGRSDLVRYQFKLPADVCGPIQMIVKLNYRRFNRRFTNWVLDKSVDYPVVEMAQKALLLNLGQNLAKPVDDKDWMRWNNYGIALLGQRQYARAVRAFTKVTELRPDYADGHINVALANFFYQKYDLSLQALNKALKLEPESLRALFYQSLIYREQGKLEAAIEGLQKVIVAFPRLREARTELGSTYYQLKKFELARGQFEALQTIDPDDLSAHYNLMRIYQRLGMRKQAAEQGAYFVDRKDDPNASAYSLDFLKTHKEISNESIPWHAHIEAGVEVAKKPAGKPAKKSAAKTTLTGQRQ
ncbi:MAG: tetratricopeptide repeat protein [Acidobacteria bacterium]|nr:tetratricopeptide repeat protein [Acidobacteriota bacterium]